MSRNRFKARIPLRRKSKIDCAMNCINSTSLVLNNNDTFDCNIFYYEPKYRICVLYQYDFSASPTIESSNQTTSLDNTASSEYDNGIYEYFIDECEIDEILSGIVGYVRYCRRLLGLK